MDKKLEKKLQAYVKTIDEELEDNLDTTKDKLQYLKKIQNTPLQRYFKDIQEGNMQLTKEILDYDKQFFQKQLNKMSKAYQVEIKNQLIKAREKAIDYVEMNLSRAKDQLHLEIVHYIDQLTGAQQALEDIIKHASHLSIKVQDYEFMVASLRTYTMAEEYEHQKMHDDLNNDEDNETELAIQKI